MASWDINGNAGANPGINFVGTTDNVALAVRTDNKEALRVDVNGNVGIGTPNPFSKLEIAAQDGLLIHGYQPFLTLKDSNSHDKRARIQTANGDVAFFTDNGLSSGVPSMEIKNDKGTVEIRAQYGLNIVGYQPFLTFSDSNSGYKRAQLQTANGDVAFFTDNGLSSGVPSMEIKNDKGTVEIRAQYGLNIVGCQPFLTLSDSNSGYKRAQLQTANGDVVFYTDNGISSGVPALAIKNDSGDAAISGNLLVAGDIRLVNADCAEDFDVANADIVEPGTIMVLGDDGALQPSQSAYDKRVASVVSGAGDYKPGIVLDKQQSRTNRKPVALLGKAYCKVDASSSPIAIGDLLTTSPTPGHAMKANDQQRAFGAVIGKALRPLKEGKGLIPVLIALQ
jgi:hypothetical protein